MFRASVPLLVCTFLLGCGVQSAARPEPAAPAPASDGPAQLPTWLRPIVRTQMQRHREYVNELRWTAASLEFERTGALAQRIVEEVQCGRPGEGTPTLDGLVPAGYLDLQEKLRERAHRLADAAKSGNSHKVTGAYQSMLEVCARCHAVYHPGPPIELPLVSQRVDD
jgi:cytochrome c553